MHLAPGVELHPPAVLWGPDELKAEQFNPIAIGQRCLQRETGREQQCYHGDGARAGDRGRRQGELPETRAQVTGNRTGSSRPETAVAPQVCQRLILPRVLGSMRRLSSCSMSPAPPPDHNHAIMIE